MGVKWSEVPKAARERVIAMMLSERGETASTLEYLQRHGGYEWWKERGIEDLSAMDAALDLLRREGGET